MGNADTVVTCFILGGVVLFLMFLIGGAIHSQGNKELRNFAAAWRGQLRGEKLWDYPRVTLKLADSNAMLEYSSGDGDGLKTHLTISLYELRLRLELRPQGIAQRLGKYLGMQDIEIGSPAFDAAFVIQGSNERAIREFLTPNVQDAILKIARCGTNGRFDLHLQMASGSLRLTKHEHLWSAVALSKFTRCCLELLEQIQKPMSTGIEFIEPSIRQPRMSLHGTECQVCGDPLVEKIVLCAKCKTPHHLDCWQYFGSCSVYGCGQKRYIVFRQ